MQDALVLKTFFKDSFALCTSIEIGLKGGWLWNAEGRKKDYVRKFPLGEGCDFYFFKGKIILLAKWDERYSSNRLANEKSFGFGVYLP